MTALQDWLFLGPFDPKNLKAMICGPQHGESSEQRTPAADELPRIHPGVERC